MQIFMLWRTVERNGQPFRPLDPDAYWRCTADNAAVVAWRTLLARRTRPMNEPVASNESLLTVLDI